MAAAAFGLGLLQLGMGEMQASAQREAGLYNQKIFEENATVAEKQAEQALKSGKRQALTSMEGTKSLISNQVAKFAAQGVDVGGGNVRAVTTDTLKAGLSDAQTIENNAWRQAWGFKEEAKNLRRQGKLAAMGGNAQAGATLATAGLNFGSNAISAFRDYKKTESIWG